MNQTVTHFERGIKCGGYPDDDTFLHRKDGPALIIERNGLLFREEWHVDNQLHRTDGPAIIEYIAGVKRWEQWFFYGEEHRKGGPAHTEYIDGKVFQEIWVFSGLPHNKDGPARIDYSPPANYYALYGVWIWEETHAKLMLLPLTKRLIELLVMVDKEEEKAISYMLRLLERHKPEIAKRLKASLLLQE